MSRLRILILALSALAFWNSAPAFARGMCNGEQQAKSSDGGPPTTITYTNSGTSDALWIWLDQHGDRQLYRTLKPGDVVHQPTFVGHYWIVANRNEDCESMIRADKGDVFKVVDEDTAAAKQDSAKRGVLPSDYAARWARGAAACKQGGDQLSIDASGYTLGQTSCKFVEGPIAMEGGYQAISDCSGHKHEIRMTLLSGQMTMQGAGTTLDNLSRCTAGASAGATPVASEAAQACAKMGNDDTVRPYSTAMHDAFANAFTDSKGPPVDADLKTGVYRCMDARLVACLVGANLPCFKMDTARHNTGADAFCQNNKDNDAVPLVASGHASIYAYKCVGTRAEIADTMYKLDERGFARDLWKRLD